MKKSNCLFILFSILCVILLIISYTFLHKTTKKDEEDKEYTADINSEVSISVKKNPDDNTDAYFTSENDGISVQYLDSEIFVNIHEDDFETYKNMVSDDIIYDFDNSFVTIHSGNNDGELVTRFADDMYIVAAFNDYDKDKFLLGNTSYTYNNTKIDAMA